MSYPRWRKVVGLAEHADRLPSTLTVHLEGLISISRRLRQEREISFYGDEELGAPADRLYSADDSTQAMHDARVVIVLAIAHVDG